jgi:hypothetical protein
LNKFEGNPLPAYLLGDPNMVHSNEWDAFSLERSPMGSSYGDPLVQQKFDCPLFGDLPHFLILYDFPRELLPKLGKVFW